MSRINKKAYWFKRRRFGYGWTPVKWQGWVSIVGFLAAVFGGISLLNNVSKDAFVEFLIGVVIASLLSVWVLLQVSYNKGPIPKWRWGKKPTDDPDDDF